MPLVFDRRLLRKVERDWYSQCGSPRLYHCQRRARRDYSGVQTLQTISRSRSADPAIYFRSASSRSLTNQNRGSTTSCNANVAAADRLASALERSTSSRQSGRRLLPKCSGSTRTTFLWPLWPVPAVNFVTGLRRKSLYMHRSRRKEC